jgi:hypothetical protein
MLRKNIIIYILILIAVSDSLLYISIRGFGNSFFTPVSLACRYLVLIILFLLIRKSNIKEDIPVPLVFFFKVYLSWNIVTILHGLVLARGYWDWKFIFFSSALFLLIPLIFFIGKNLQLAQKSFYYFINYGLVYGFLLIPISQLTNQELYARIMIPISFFIILIPYVKNRHKIMIVIVSIVAVLTILDFRANLIKITISILIVTTYYVKNFFPKVLYKVFHIILFAIPIMLLISAISGGFNIFQELADNAKYEVKTNYNDASNLAADTRTFLYLEVFQTLDDNNSWIIGQGAAGKYKSDFFTELVTGNMRYSSEVGFLNTMLYSGIVGVLAYLLILFGASYYAIYRSKNILSKMFGLIIASRWLLFFLEEFTQFDLNFYFMWVIIGLVSSKKFRSLSDLQLREFFSFQVRKAKMPLFDNRNSAGSPLKSL